MDIDVFDLVDKGIIFCASSNWIDKWKVQKGVFYLLWLMSVYKKIDFLEIVSKAGISPDKQGHTVKP